MPTIYIDGRSRPPAEQTVPVLDRGFLYGDSIFETVRTYGGRPYALDEHLARLKRSADRVLIELPVPLATLKGEVLAALEEAGHSESYIRIMITRGSGPLGLDPTEASDPLRVIIVGPLVRPPDEAYEQGVGVVALHTQRHADATQARGAKVANYLVAVLALQKARETGAHECLVIDADGRVVEGANSNVFAVIDDVLVTPPEKDGPLLGITRSRILEVARGTGVTVAERTLPLDQLRGADEAFISSSIREILPVVSLDGAPIGGGRPGPVTRKLHAAFREKIKKDMALDGAGVRGAKP